MAKLRLSIFQKTAGAFLVIIVIVLASNIFIYVNLNQNYRINARINHVNSPSVKYLNQLYALIVDSKMLIKNWVFIEKKSDTADKLRLKELHAQTYPDLVAQIDPLLGYWESTETALFHEINALVADSLFAMHRVIMERMADFSAYEDPMVIFEVVPLVDEGGAIISLTDSILVRLNGLRSGMELQAEKGQAEMEASFSAFRRLVWTSAILVLLMAFAISMIISFNIRHAIKQAVDIVHRFSEGDLTVAIAHDRGDEIGELFANLAAMIEKLKTIIGTLIETSKRLHEASHGFHDNAANLSKGAEVQLNSAGEVREALDEISQLISQNNASAQNTDNVAKSAARDIQQSSRQVLQTLEAMQMIKEKIKVIVEISLKTNILSLNASVEAARAGEHGKGFSVVAAEVRKLAEHVQKTTAEIESLVRDSLKVAEGSENTLRAIVPEIKRTSDLVQEIYQYSHQQEEGARKIGEAVGRLGTIIRDNAGASRTMVDNSSGLKALASELNEIVKFFKVGS